MHEHTRVDRDQHINLNKDLIDKIELEDFVRPGTYSKEFKLCNESKIGELYNCKTFNAYDKASIMHYGDTIGINKTKIFTSIVPCDNGDCRFGQRESLSTTDIKDIEDAYSCGK